MTDWAPRRAAFRALHVDGCFILPNPWDIGSARRLKKLGFKALASSSSTAAKPVNVLLMNDTMHVAELAALGVRRVSTGGALANAAWKAFDEVARRLGSPKI